jgi:TolB-like protein/DNA-binding winged helix-turn-helix (wHTH) protein/tetratricopeptide (TPR) repeat protein
LRGCSGPGRLAPPGEKRALDTPDREQATKRPGPPPGRWRFAAFELDETSGRLRAAGQWHALDHGSYGVLLALLRQSGVLVGKDTLLHAGWPGRVVSENSLPKAIGRLRQLLGDAEGELLCTAHGYGYRLAAHAEWSAPAGKLVEPVVPQTQPPDGPPIPAPRSQLRVLLLLALLLAVAAGAYTLARLEPPAATAPLGGPPVADVGDARSIAVLPFADMSQAHDQRYFSDGLTDELLDRLAQLPQLRVASRTSSFALRDSLEGVGSIGRQLGVATVLEGSVRRDGDRVRITVQLIKVRDGFHLWSETYDRQMTDIFAVQDEIAHAVVQALRLKLLPGQDDAVTRHRTRSIGAYNELIRGRGLEYLGTPDNDRRAIAAYERAIAIDPEFSSAYAQLANLLGGDARYADSPAQVAAGKLRSIALMDRAIALEPDRAEFYLARADFLYSTRHDWHAAQRDLDIASRLYGDRQPSDLLMRQCRLYAVLGRIEEAIAAERLAIAGDPQSTWAWSMLGYHLAVIGQYDEAHRALAKADQIKPDDDHTPYYDGLAWLLEREPKRAIAAFELSGSEFRLVGLAAAQSDAGNDSVSRSYVQTLETRYAPTGAYQAAQAHAWRRENDQAFAWLERAAQQQDAGVMYLRFDPMMRRLHGDPRYLAWLRRLKLDDESLASAELAPSAP